MLEKAIELLLYQPLERAVHLPPFARRHYSYGRPGCTVIVPKAQNLTDKGTGENAEINKILRTSSDQRPPTENLRISHDVLKK